MAQIANGVDFLLVGGEKIFIGATSIGAVI